MAKASPASIRFNSQLAIGSTSARALPLPQVAEPAARTAHTNEIALATVAPVAQPIAQGSGLPLVELPAQLPEMPLVDVEPAAFASPNPLLAAPVIAGALRKDTTTDPPAPAGYAVPDAFSASALMLVLPSAEEGLGVTAPVTLPQQPFVTAPQTAPGIGVTPEADLAGLGTQAAIALSPVIAPPDPEPPTSQLSASQPAPLDTALTALPAAAKPLAGVPGLGTSAAFPLEINSQLVTRVDGKTAGTLDFRQTTTGLSVRLGSIVEVLGDRYEPAQIDRIRASAASDVYLSLADLKAQGIPISYDPVYDEFNIGQTDTRPTAARKVHMDQISAPERGLGSSAIDQIRR